MFQKIGIYFIEKLIGWAWQKLTQYYKKTQKTARENEKVQKQVKRLQKAIKAGYDGSDLTPEQERELIDAARDLIRNY